MNAGNHHDVKGSPIRLITNAVIAPAANPIIPRIIALIGGGGSTRLDKQEDNNGATIDLIITAIFPKKQAPKKAPKAFRAVDMQMDNQQEKIPI